MRIRDPGPARAARQLIERHGLAAGAVAQEYAAEARLSGDAGRLHHWHQVRSAIGELRRTWHTRSEPVPALF